MVDLRGGSANAISDGLKYAQLSNNPALAMSITAMSATPNSGAGTRESDNIPF